MAESFVLPSVPRGTVLPEAERLARLDEATPLVLAAVEGEDDEVALLATLACVLHETMVQASFTGFYRRIGPRLLAVGPYQGPLACLRIPFERGVCGLAAREARVVYVPDVDAFPGHIACDGGARSELVVPVRKKGELLAVLDLDSHAPAAFSEAEGAALVRIFDRIFG